METVLRQTSLLQERPVCGCCGRDIKDFSTFRMKDTSPYWNGGRPIVQLCLGCARVKDEVEDLMEGILY